MGCNPFAIARHSHLDALHEVVFWDLRYGYIRSGVVHAGRMCIKTEEVDVACWPTVCLQTLVGLLTIVERWAEAVNLHERRGDKGWLAPCACCNGVFGLDMAIDCLVLVLLYLLWNIACVYLRL
jgi:hypothetical protein